MASEDVQLAADFARGVHTHGLPAERDRFSHGKESNATNVLDFAATLTGDPHATSVHACEKPCRPDKVLVLFGGHWQEAPKAAERPANTRRVKRKA